MDRAALAYKDELQKVGIDLVDGATVKPNRGISCTEYSVTGALPCVLKAVQAIFETFPSLGYGTHVKYMTQLSDGSYGAQMGRNNSCE